MEAIFLVIPILLFSVIGGKRWITTLVSIGIVGIILFGLSASLRMYNFSDTEYLSYYYTKIRHEESWNERVRHTRRVFEGYDKNGHPKYRSETYWEIKYHPDKWLALSNEGTWSDLGKEEFSRFRDLWSTPPSRINLFRDYYTKDGDAVEYSYCGHREHIKGYTVSRPYENRILGSVLRYRDMSVQEARSLGLHDYDRDKCILGLVPTKEEKQALDYINWRYGKSKQIHVIILGFPSSRGVEVVEEQKVYWQGGNKNELVVCLGINPKTRCISWAECFSWQDDITLDCKIRDFLVDQKKLDLVALGRFIERNLGYWKRKEFKDYSYVSSYLTVNQYILVFVVVLVLTVIIGTCQHNYINKEYEF